MPPFPFKTVPFEKQRAELTAMAAKPFWAWFWEQGTGKTKLAIDNAAWLHMKGLVNGLLWVAPNGPHANFVIEELPLHMPATHTSIIWRSGKMEFTKDKVK